MGSRTRQSAGEWPKRPHSLARVLAKRGYGLRLIVVYHSSMSYVYFVIAVLSEITATMTLKSTQTFTRFWPSIVVIAGVCSSLYFFALCLRTLNVAIVYAVWSGIGICAVTLLGWLIHGEKLDSSALIGIALILTGVIVINLFSRTVEIPPAASQPELVETKVEPSR